MKPLTPRDLTLLQGPLPELFRDIYKKVVTALADQHQPDLIKHLEGRLYTKVIQSLATLESKGLSLQLNPAWQPSLPSLHNFQIHMGVHLQRKLNTSDYQVFNIEQVKSALSPQHIEKATGLDLTQNLSHVWVYASPDAPAKVIYSVDALFKGVGPLYIDRLPGQEEHVFRLECVRADAGDQGDWEDADSLTSLLSQADSQSEVSETTWEVVDIDHLLGGNPHTSAN